MTQVVTQGLLLVGATMTLLAAVGVVRLPDLFMRMQAVSKAAAMGVGCTFLGVAVHFQDADGTSRALLTVAFFFITVPISAQVIARTALVTGVPMIAVVDELRAHEAELDEAEEGVHE
ncbi:MAG: monovalent cation/H(+) antiporter subunit G [Myxococcota bacterium]